MVRLAGVTTSTSRVRQTAAESGMDARLASVRVTSRKALERNRVLDRLGLDDVHGMSHVPSTPRWPMVR